MGDIITKIKKGDDTNLISSSFYGLCDTEADVQTKNVRINNSYINTVSLATGMLLTVRFTNHNTAENPKIMLQNLDGTVNLLENSMPIYRTTNNPIGSSISTSWVDGAVVSFICTGTSSSSSRWIKVGNGERFVYSNTVNGNPYISYNEDANQPITIWQNVDNENVLYGLVTGKNSIGLYGPATSTATQGSWLWKTPTFPAGQMDTWPISIGGTGATTATQARYNLNAAGVDDQSTQKVAFTPLTGSTQVQGIYFNVTNEANTTYKDKRLALFLTNSTATLWNSTDGTTIWNAYTTKNTVSISNGGTGATTASQAWENLGGGDIGKKDILAASDIPNLSASKITSGTLGLKFGGTGTNNESITANRVFAGPSSGNAGNASFRSLVAADIPNLNASKITAGTFNADRIPDDINITGNAGTATKLKTARSLYVNLGSAYNSSSPVTFDGSAAKALPINGTLGVAHGGTGISSNPSMLVNLGTTSAASVFAASPRPGITGTLSIAHGGTGVTGVTTVYNNTDTNVTVYKWGPIVTIRITGYTYALSKGNNHLVATVGSAIKPSKNISNLVAAAGTGNDYSSLARIWVSKDNGNIYISQVNTTASCTWYGSFSYIVA